VDIYPANAKFNDEAACPVNGVVKDVKKYCSPSLFPDKPPIYEYLTLIESDENPSVYVKIIHACPKVRVGQSVSVGDKFAVLIRSGYYPFWVDPHIHVELRNPDNPLRAQGSYCLGVLNASDVKKHETKTPSENGILGVVTKVENRYAIVRPNPEHWVIVGIFSGLKVRVGKTIGILDGGIPFMGYAGVVAGEKLEVGTQVILNGTRIGEVTESLSGLAKLKTAPFKIIVDGCEYLGVSSKLCLGDIPEIKLVPLKACQISVHVGETIEITKS